MTKQNIKAISHTNLGLLKIDGADAASFLQGLITNDIKKLTESNGLYTAFLTPQGRYLFDFFITKHTNTLFLEVSKDRIPELLKRLTLYKLRSDVKLFDMSDQYGVFTLEFLQTLSKEFKIYEDPRHKSLNYRGYGPLDSFNSLDWQWLPYEEYEVKRLTLGIPEGIIDLIPEKSIPLECNLDELNAIDWQKGCYLGQELTSRTKHRGLVRKRLLPYQIEGGALSPFTPLYFEGAQIGETRSNRGSVGLAMVRLEALEQSTIHAPITTEHNKTSLSFTVPSWLNLA